MKQINRISCGRFCLAALCVSVAVSLVSCGGQDRSQFIPPAGKYDVTILRDTWGIPHIFGKTDADAAYGLGFAQSEDDWVNTQEAMLLVRGKMASIKGKDAALYDYMGQLFRIHEFVDEKYETEIPEDTRKVVEAYAEGITHYAALHPDKMPHVKLPVTGKDIVAGATLKSPFFYEMHHDLQKLFAGDGGVPISASGIMAWAEFPENNPFAPEGNIGSNAWAVGPTRSADGATRLAINSHMPWVGQVTWYEAHVRSEEGWNMIGGTFPGGPVIFKGHDENKGWCHTINRPDLADIYELEINPENEDQYKLDGAWKDFEKGTARIKVKLWGPFSWTVKREMIWSDHGPVLRTPSGVFAIRFSGYGEVRQLDQWYKMNKARNLEEFKAAMATQGLVSLNTLYADKEGNLYYCYYGKFPDRPDGFQWQEILPGDDSKAIWEGFLPFERTPQITNPASGFVMSCNNSPYQSTDGPDNLKPEDFDPNMGLETYMTNRGLRALEVYGSDPSITRDEFYEYKYDKTYSEKSWMGGFLRELAEAPVAEDEQTKRAVELLLNWDRQTTADSRAAALAILAIGRYEKGMRHDIEVGGPAEMVGEAAKILMTHFGRIDPEWSEVLRLRHGDLDLPIAGGPDCLRAVDVALEDDGRLIGVNGDCYFLMVEWDKDGKVSAEGIHQFGSATVDESSPHYNDQAPLFAKEQTRPSFFTEEEIRANLAREYRPGE